MRDTPAEPLADLKTPLYTEVRMLMLECNQDGCDFSTESVTEAHQHLAFGHLVAHYRDDHVGMILRPAKCSEKVWNPHVEIQWPHIMDCPNAAVHEGKCSLHRTDLDGERT
jgi:hypothetical protein